MLKKNIALWSLYDFANSIVMIVFLFYFSQRIVVEQWLSEMRWNITLPIASVIFIVVAPRVGRSIDHGYAKIRSLRFWTVLATVLFLITSLLALYTPEFTTLTIVVYSLAMGAYLTCFVAYTPMLNDLATQDNHGQISGRGQWVNSFGQIIGLLIAIPIVQGLIPGLWSGRVATFLPATILFFLCALPMLVWYDQPEQPREQHKHIVEQRNVWQLFKELISSKVVRLFLCGYFFFSDALLTFSSNFPLYLEKVHNIDDTHKSLLSACILLCASLGAFFSGKFADRKWLARSLWFLLIIRCVIFPVFVFIKWFTALVIMSCIAGVFYWPVWSVSRALFTKMLPQHLAGTGLTYFTMCERFSTFIWPLIRWGIVSSLGGTPLWYKYALIAMSVLVLIWAVLNRKSTHAGHTHLQM